MSLFRSLAVYKKVVYRSLAVYNWDLEVTWHGPSMLNKSCAHSIFWIRPARLQNVSRFFLQGQMLDPSGVQRKRLKWLPNAPWISPKSLQGVSKIRSNAFYPPLIEPRCSNWRPKGSCIRPRGFQSVCKMNPSLRPRILDPSKAQPGCPKCMPKGVLKECQGLQYEKYNMFTQRQTFYSATNSLLSDKRFTQRQTRYSATNFLLSDDISSGYNWTSNTYKSLSRLACL